MSTTDVVRGEEPSDEAEGSSWIWLILTFIFSPTLVFAGWLMSANKLSHNKPRV